MKQNETHNTCVESTKEIDWTLRNKWLNPALKEGIISYVLNERLIICKWQECVGFLFVCLFVYLFWLLFVCLFVCVCLFVFTIKAQQVYVDWKFCTGHDMKTYMKLNIDSRFKIMMTQFRFDISDIAVQQYRYKRHTHKNETRFVYYAE